MDQQQKRSEYTRQACAKPFQSGVALQQHTVSKRKQQDEPTAAAAQQEPFPNVDAAGIRINKKKKKAVQHKCHTCAKVFQSGGALEQHTSSKHKQQEEPTATPITAEQQKPSGQNIVTGAKTNKKKEEKTVPLQCRACSKVFQSKAALRSHKLSKHKKHKQIGSQQEQKKAKRAKEKLKKNGKPNRMVYVCVPLLINDMMKFHSRGFSKRLIPRDYSSAPSVSKKAPKVKSSIPPLNKTELLCWISAITFRFYDDQTKFVSLMEAQSHNIAGIDTSCGFPDMLAPSFQGSNMPLEQSKSLCPKQCAEPSSDMFRPHPLPILPSIRTRMIVARKRANSSWTDWTQEPLLDDETRIAARKAESTRLEQRWNKIARNIPHPCYCSGKLYYNNLRHPFRHGSQSNLLVGNNAAKTPTKAATRRIRKRGRIMHKKQKKQTRKNNGWSSVVRIAPKVRCPNNSTKKSVPITTSSSDGTNVNRTCSMKKTKKKPRIIRIVWLGRTIDIEQ